MDAKLLGHEDDRADNLLPRLVHVPLESHVQLQGIKMIGLQHIQGGVAAAEIVQPALIARLPETVNFQSQPLSVPLQGRLRDFHMEKLRGTWYFFTMLSMKRKGL